MLLFKEIMKREVNLYLKNAVHNFSPTLTGTVSKTI